VAAGVVVSRGPMSRMQQDARSRRGAVWVDVVAPAFNCNETFDVPATCKDMEHNLNVHPIVGTGERLRAEWTVVCFFCAAHELSHQRHIDTEPGLIEGCHVNTVCGCHWAPGTFPPCSELPSIYVSYLSTNRGCIHKPKLKHVEITSRSAGSGVSHVPASGATQEGAHAAECGPAISEK